ncbi:MAG: LuxR family transcriptional regulator [Rhodobacteraceae bacterium]|nr:LuxR family transcriptional regulator [Paracoccaceae bacterium]
MLSKLAPAGYYIALRVGFYAPEREMNAFPSDWTDYYTRDGLALVDPYMQWCQRNAGISRWSAVDLPDPYSVAFAYRRFGIPFGASVSITGTITEPRRSFGVFAHPDREFSEEEMALLHDALDQLHSANNDVLTPAQAAALRLLSQGKRQKEIAALLGISISAVKARLKSASERLGASTPIEAASIAASSGML